MKKNPEISIILPCRNEEKALSHCLKQIKEVVKNNKLDAEIIVSDSSIDSSPRIARENNVILLKHDKEGYGIAYLEAFKITKGKYLFLADADGTYDFNEIPEFVRYLKEGYDLVLGNRLSGRIEKGAMPWSHKHLGNPILSKTLRLFFGTKIKDTQTGMRAIKKDSLQRLNLRTTGMEFASEMIIKAIKNKLNIKEIPINYKNRIGSSKLRPFSDAWKHFRFMLLYSPLFLFFIPGLISLLLGIESLIWIYFGDANILGLKLFYHPMFISSILTILGYQLIFFGFFAKTYSITHLGEESKFMERLYKHITIEKASITGILLGIVGLIIYIIIILKLIKSGFGDLSEIKNSIVALTFVTIGIQTIFNSFMLSILGIKEK